MACYHTCIRDEDPVPPPSTASGSAHNFIPVCELVESRADMTSPDSVITAPDADLTALAPKAVVAKAVVAPKASAPKDPSPCKRAAVAASALADSSAASKRARTT